MNLKGIVCASFIALSAIMCTGCNSSGGSILEKAPDINVPFSSSVKIQAGELEFEGEIKRRAAGIWDMTVTAPDTLKGLSVMYDDGSGVKAVLDDISLEVPVESIKESAVFPLIFKAIDCAASSGTLSFTETEDGRVCSGEFSGGAYILKLDPKTSAITGIEIPNEEISGEFTGFAVIEEEIPVPEDTEDLTDGSEST